ncbi:sugar ABC transporter [Pseudolysinimonas kribbensis]|uniref:Sugar ABC transporter n=1 Tax=Pseudolysinimonas kribbensis TaxID=433641 RepID=A0ABQ6K4N6_9MICO|nr:carbohydrate ABC transporter permease [Pseudolysinimonas kribbensis]GMA95393.1 sugar ABC transporter [Pseudolysinimonas kribbensis]
MLIVLAGFPIYWMYDTAITPRDQLFTGQPLIPDVTRTPQIFDVFTSGVPLLQWLANSSIVAFCTTFLSLLLAVLAGYGLSRYRFHGRGVVGFILFATQMLPEALLIVPLYALFAGLGLLNGLVGLVLADTAFVMPVAVWIVKSAMDSIPYEIEEAARVDGCPRFVILLRIMLPLSAPSIAAAAVIMFFDAWNEYLFASTFIQDRDKWTASVGLSSFIGEFITPLSTVFSAAIVFTIPAIVFFLLVQRHIVSGLTAGSVKG